MRHCHRPSCGTGYGVAGCHGIAGSCGGYTPSRHKSTSLTVSLDTGRPSNKCCDESGDERCYDLRRLFTLQRSPLDAHIGLAQRWRGSGANKTNSPQEFMTLSERLWKLGDPTTQWRRSQRARLRLVPSRSSESKLACEVLLPERYR